MEEFLACGCSVASFCKEHEINRGTFYNWLAKERGHEIAPAFQEVHMPVPSSGREVRVRLPNQVEVAVSVDSPAELAFVLREAARC